MTEEHADTESRVTPGDALFKSLIVLVEYAIVASLLAVAGDVLVRSVVTFFRTSGPLPPAVVAAIDGILVVIILLDIAHTVFGNLRAFVFPVRPFLIIGVLAGVRDILSASARLSLSSSLTTSTFNDTIISLALGVGVVIFLLGGLVILNYSKHADGQVED